MGELMIVTILKVSGVSGGEVGIKFRLDPTQMCMF